MRGTLIELALVAGLVAACGGSAATGAPSTTGPGGSAATTSSAGPGTATAATIAPAASIDTGTTVNVTTAPDHAASALIDEDGGKLTATLGSITYTLTVPVDALLSPVTITMTPIAAITGSPLDQPPAAGVVFSPDGLVLAAPATLTITGGPPTAGSIGFGFDGSGQDFHLMPFIPGTGVVIPVPHFSGIGYGVASSAVVTRIAAMHVANRIDAIYQEGAADFAAHKTDPGIAQRLRDRADEAEKIAQDGMTAALGDPLVLGSAAIMQLFVVERTLQLLGSKVVSDLSKIAELLDKADAALDKMCTEGSADPVATFTAILASERMREIAVGPRPGTDAAAGAALQARLNACERTLSVKPEIAWYGLNVVHSGVAPDFDPVYNVTDSMILAGPLTALALGFSPSTRTPLGTKPTGRRYRWKTDVLLAVSNFKTSDWCWTGAPPTSYPGYEPTLHVEIAPDLNVATPLGVPKKGAGAPPPTITAAVTLYLKGAVSYDWLPPHDLYCETQGSGHGTMSLLLLPSWTAVNGSSPERVFFGGGAVGWTRKSPLGSTQSRSAIGYYEITTNVAYSVSK